MSSHTELNFPLSSKPEIKTYSNIKTYKEIYIYKEIQSTTCYKITQPYDK